MDSLETINSKDRKSVILVTHDAKYLPYAHRVFYMRDGVLRRIVVNPEKEQIKRVKPGETIVTEIEQLARLYPYAEPIELKVKSVVNFATQTVGFSQLERLEKAVLQVLRGFMDDEMFYDFLVRPLKNGGIGMHVDESKTIARRVFALMRYSREVQRFREQMHEDSMFMNQQKFVDRLLEFIIEEVGLKLDQKQLAVLQQGIAERVGGIINGDDFFERLTLPIPLGGVALTAEEGFQISRYLEKLIAQGGYVIRANELLGAHT